MNNKTHNLNLNRYRNIKLYYIIIILYCIILLRLHYDIIYQYVILYMVTGRAIEFAKSYEETGPGTPVFFILSPGVDPLKDVEALGKKLGQEIVAEQAMDLASKEGHWVVLQVCFIWRFKLHLSFSVWSCIPYLMIIMNFWK